MKRKKFSTEDVVKKWFKRFLLVPVGVGVFFGIRGIASLDLIGSSPQINLQSKQEAAPFKPNQENFLGKEPTFRIFAKNKNNRICQIDAKITQNGKEAILGTYQSKTARKDLSPEEEKNGVELKLTDKDFPAFGFTEGPAELTVFAKDCSLLRRKTTLNQKVKFDFYNPSVQITSSQHYINQGGADLVTFKVSPDTVSSAVQVGPYTFKSYPRPGSDPKSGERFAFFVFSYDLPSSTKIQIFATDEAGNRGTATLTPAKFFPKEFRHREMPIDDNFIQTRVADIINNTLEIKSQGDPLKDFLLVNRDLRKKNMDFVMELARKSEETFFWKDAFRPLGNASVEGAFADYRSYIYNNEKVDEQVHLGFDLASVERNPIVAAADGKVLYAGYLGIYGNVVIIDHGYGLTSLYGHLSVIDVKAGDLITKGGKLGSSGTTGLAGGDHLHFSLLIQGVQTNPIEFWDQSWIKNHVYLRIDPSNFGQAGVAITHPAN